MEEFEAVREAMNTSSDFDPDDCVWLGGSYDMSAKSFKWAGSGASANVPEMFKSYPPKSRGTKYMLYYDRSERKLSSLPKRFSFQGLCEET